MSAPRRFLFVMHYPGYLRYFDSTVRLLAERGHHVDVVFDSPHKQAEGMEALEDVAGVEMLGRTPQREDVWAVVASAIRGTIDYVRYLHPDFEDATYLRDRMRKAVPGVFASLARRTTASAGVTRALVWLFRMCERAIPSSPALERFIASRTPDAVLVTPLVTARCPQADVVKSAQALGIPAAVCVASWDHLTTKGLIRVDPDLVAVWNDEQKAEALAYHDVPADRIVVTGAQPFDRWFERQPTDRDAFCAKVGLRSDRPYVLFVGSTASISAPDAELRFVRQWIEAVRRVPALGDVGILVRPHPYNSTHWSDVDFADLPNVTVYPRTANPVNESDRQDYFDSLYHSEAVVGVNTTAMIEAAIVGRTVHSVLAEEFKDTQGGTLHFRYMLAENGGFLRVARTLDDHAAQLAETLRTPGMGRAACARFVERFVRPHGRDTRSTPVLSDALVRLAVERRTPTRRSVLSSPLRALLWAGGRMAVSRNPSLAPPELRKQMRVKHGTRRDAARKPAAGSGAAETPAERRAQL
jgi:hypothetical protein